LQTAKHKSATEKMKTEIRLLPIPVANLSFRQNYAWYSLMLEFHYKNWKTSLLEKYTKQHIPSESSLRKHYIDNNFNNVMDRVRREVAYNKIWISIDETIDPVGRFVANVVI
ncbi:hypothetical protein T06_6771, partial [Trichinella sp. T6]